MSTKIRKPDEDWPEAARHPLPPCPVYYDADGVLHDLPRPWWFDGDNSKWEKALARCKYEHRLAVIVCYQAAAERWGIDLDSLPPEAVEVFTKIAAVEVPALRFVPSYQLVKDESAEEADLRIVRAKRRGRPSKDLTMRQYFMLLAEIGAEPHAAANDIARRLEECLGIKRDTIQEYVEQFRTAWADVRADTATEFQNNIVEVVAPWLQETRPSLGKK